MRSGNKEIELKKLRLEVRKILTEASITAGTKHLGSWNLTVEDAKAIFGRLSSVQNSRISDLATKALSKVSSSSEDQVGKMLDTIVFAYAATVAEKGISISGSRVSGGDDFLNRISKNRADLLLMIDSIEKSSSGEKPSPSRSAAAAGEIKLDRLSPEKTIEYVYKSGVTAGQKELDSASIDIASRAKKIRSIYVSSVIPGLSTADTKNLISQIVETYDNPASNTSGDSLSDSAKSVVTMLRVANATLDERFSKEMVAQLLGGGLVFASVFAGPATTKVLSSRFLKKYLEYRGGKLGGTDISKQIIADLGERRSKIISDEQPKIAASIKELQAELPDSVQAQIEALETAIKDLMAMLPEKPEAVTGVIGGRSSKSDTKLRDTVASSIERLRTKISDLAPGAKKENADAILRQIDDLTLVSTSNADELRRITDTLRDPRYEVGMRALAKGEIGGLLSKMIGATAATSGLGLIFWSGWIDGFDRAFGRLSQEAQLSIQILALKEGSLPDELVPGRDGELYQELSGPIDRGNLESSIEDLLGNIPYVQAPKYTDALLDLIETSLSDPASPATVENSCRMLKELQIGGSSSKKTKGGE